MSGGSLFDDSVDEFIRNLNWASSTSEYEKSLVAGNIRGFAASLSPALKGIASERLRQVSVKGWTKEHDDRQFNGDIALAAACYAKVSIGLMAVKPRRPSWWPWDKERWKPQGRLRNLDKAGALIIAEIERIYRENT